MKNIVKKSLLLFIMSISLTGCGNISDKVSQSLSTIEIGKPFDIEKAFICEDGITIKLKSNEKLNTSELGAISCNFLISDGKNEEEKNYTFNIIDTEPPEIETKDATLYTGEKFKPKKYVKCTDNSGEKVTASVKASDLDTTQEGRYSVTYQATDSSGNSSEQTMTVNVISVKTSADTMDLIDQFISKKEYSNFSSNVNDFDAVFVRGENLESQQITPTRTLTIYPEIYILEDIFSSNSTFKVANIIFRCQFNDTSEQNDRYNLYGDQLIIKTESNSFTNFVDDDEIPELGEFDRNHYLSKFSYSLNINEISQLSSMLDSDSITFELQTINQKHASGKSPISLNYVVQGDDIESLKRLIKLYNRLLNILGEYGKYE